jgi:hypothetical protein
LTFIETRHFTRVVYVYLDEASYRGLQKVLAAKPDEGAVVRGSGGVRKLRWALPGRGKRGGVRVIYYVRASQDQIWMLAIYAKSEESVIPAHILKQIREEIDDQG